jgi:hypothetical protein
MVSSNCLKNVIRPKSSSRASYRWGLRPIYGLVDEDLWSSARSWPENFSSRLFRVILLNRNVFYWCRLVWCYQKFIIMIRLYIPWCIGKQSDLVLWLIHLRHYICIMSLNIIVLILLNIWGLLLLRECFN